MARQRAGPYTEHNVRKPALREQRELEEAAGLCVMRNSLQSSSKASSQSPAQTSSFTFALVKMMASLLMTMGIVTGEGAMADERLELHEQMVPQRPGMKTEDDYQRFVKERGLQQRSEPTPKDMDRLRAESQKELRLEEEYSRRNSSNLSNMSDDEILDAIRLKRADSIEPPSVDAREDWPKTPEEFEKKYGRPPQRREEIDFYFDTDDDSDE
jgi:hypothetical protein